MQNRCSKKLENHCQNGSQNELKSIKISFLRRPLAIDSLIFGVLERCQNIMFFLVPRWRLKKSKSWPKMRPKDPQPRNEILLWPAWCPRAAPRATWYKILNHESQDTKASWLRVQGTFEGLRKARV